LAKLRWQATKQGLHPTHHSPIYAHLPPLNTVRLKQTLSADSNFSSGNRYRYRVVDTETWLPWWERRTSSEEGRGRGICVPWLFLTCVLTVLFCFVFAL